VNERFLETGLKQLGFDQVVVDPVLRFLLGDGHFIQN
jgi:hypothetical protein